MGLDVVLKSSAVCPHSKKGKGPLPTQPPPGAQRATWRCRARATPSPTRSQATLWLWMCMSGEMPLLLLPGCYRTALWS